MTLLIGVMLLILAFGAVIAVRAYLSGSSIGILKKLFPGSIPWKMAGGFALVIAAVIVAASGGLVPPMDWFRHAPSFMEVSEWAWGHWFILLIACGGASVAMRMASAKAAQQYAGVPIGILVFLLVLAPIFASPIGIWTRTQLGVSGYSRPLCPDMSPDASTRCNLTEAWSLPFSIDRLTYKDEYFRCVNVPDPKLLEWRKVGPNEFEYRSRRGILPVRFRLESSPSCPITP